MSAPALSNEERLGLAEMQAKIRGWYLVPMVPNTKRPAILDWRNQASNDPTKIHEWWGGRYKGYNVGIVTGRGLLVLDIDCKNGKQGLASLERLERELGLPWGIMRMRTPSGGLHIYLAAPRDFEIKQKTNNLPDFPGIDVTHCVAGAGSTIDGKCYAPITPPHGANLNQAIPEELLLLCRLALAKVRPTELKPVVELDTESAVRRSVDYLCRHPDIRLYDNSDYKTYAAAAVLRAFGLSERMCVDLICEHWVEAGKTEPQFDPEWVEGKVANAFCYAPGAPGELHGLAQFPAIDASYKPQSGEVASWLEPTDLWTSSSEPPDLPRGVIPDLVERYARDRGRRLGVEPGAIATLSIVALSSLIHASNEIQVRQKDPHWIEKPILWAMLVGNPGSNKSATLTQAIAPVRKAEKVRNSDFVAVLTSDEHKTAKQGAPERWRKIINDATTESIGLILSKNPHGLLLVNDELSGLFGGMDAYRVKGEKDRPFWLAAKEGAPFLVDRSGKPPLYVPRNAVSIAGGIQPDKIRSLAAKAKLTDDGFLQRFWPVWIKRVGPGEDDYPDQALDEAITKLAIALSEAPADSRFRFSPDADAELVAIERFKAEQLRNGQSDGFSTFIDKSSGSFARLALAFHFIEWFSDEISEFEKDPPQLISVETARRARLFLSEFVLPQAAVFYKRTVQTGEADSHAQWIGGYILSRGLTQIKERELDRAYRALRGRERRSHRLSAMHELEAENWVRGVGKVHRDGGPSEWLVNPKALDGRFGERAEHERSRRAAVREAIAEAANQVPRA